MKQYIKPDEWRIIEDRFHPEFNRVSESLFSLGNGYMGVRGNFEEPYSGDTLPGSYVGGVYYPERLPEQYLRPGLPDHYMKMPNAANWIGINVELDGESLDLAKCSIQAFSRILDLKQGVLERRFRARLRSGKEVEVHAMRFCSMAQDEIAVIRYAVTPVNFHGTLTLTPFIDLNVANEQTAVEEKFWVEVEALARRTQAYMLSETRKTEFQVCTGMKFAIFQKGQPTEFSSFRIQRERYVACSVDLPCKEGQETVIYKYVANLSSLNHPKEGLVERCKHIVKQAAKAGFDQLLAEHTGAWAMRWEASDIVIEGDLGVQQGIRFNIFHLHQSYSGNDERLSVSPQGFTGERRGGCTFWSAEAFCLPFFTATMGADTGRQLLLYRCLHLPKAIENARRLGFSEGAALYPMVAMDGEECDPEWEIALEEIHRNGAIAYGVFDYVRLSGDHDFLVSHGLELLIAIARFWSQRVHYVEHRRQYVIHGVTGPNEYAVNVNNNWYTNYLAAWCLRYTLEVCQFVSETHPKAYQALSDRLEFHEYTETKRWRDIVADMYLPWDEEQGIIPQHDGYLDNEPLTISSLTPEERPLYQHWSWDRILRSAYIQRADVLQGLFMFDTHFDEETLRRNFDFYDQRTVHESSLSAAVHATLAAWTGDWNKALAFLRHSIRLDLDDYTGDTSSGCHVTSMGGSWLAVVKGMAGVRVDGEGKLSLRPSIPPSWQQYRFRLSFRGRRLEISVDRAQVRVVNLSDEALELEWKGQVIRIGGGTQWTGYF